MDSTVLTLFALLLGLGLGGLLGWFLAARPIADLRERLALRDGEARDLDEKFRAAIRELAGASERAARVDGLSGELVDTRADREALRAELARLKANAAHFEEQKRLLIDAQSSLRKEFEAAGAKVLESAQAALLARAQERFTQSEEKNEARIKALLEPVGQRLASYEAQVGKLEKERVDAFGQLGGLIQSLREGQEAVRTEAARLGNSLRNAPKARGRWGEQQLRNVLEQCGLAEHTDFVTEHSIDTDEGRLRPDAVVRIPGQKQLVIDAKVSLNAYQQAFEAAGLVFQDEGLGIVAGLDVLQALAHRVLRVFGDDARAGHVLAVLGVVRDRVVHVGDAALVDQVHDELELVQALEVGPSRGA